MLPAAEFKDLQKILDEIYIQADVLNISWLELAHEAGLSSATVYRIGRYKTMYPRVQTVMQLARAVKMDMSLVFLKKEKRRVS